MLFLMREPYYFWIFQFWPNHWTYNFSSYLYVGSEKAIRTFLSILNESLNVLSIYFYGSKLSCITTPKSFCYFSIDIIFFPNLHVNVGRISLFHISNTRNYFVSNSISHILLHSYCCEHVYVCACACTCACGGWDEYMWKRQNIHITPALEELSAPSFTLTWRTLVEVGWPLMAARMVLWEPPATMKANTPDSTVRIHTVGSVTEYLGFNRVWNALYYSLT